MARLRSLEGVRAVVTGASSGIGRVLAQRLAAGGARVALLARRQAELEALATEIRRHGGEAWPIPCDLADPEQAERAAARSIAALGGVDLLVNNAGYGRHRRFLDWDVDDMERMLRVNFLAALHLTKRLLPAMVEQHRGWLVFVASVAGRVATPLESAYVASKFALVGWARSLSLELEDEGVHVLVVCPGAVRTPFFDDEALALLPPAARRTMVSPEDLAEAILRALARGRRELTYPRALAAAYLAQEIAPGWVRRQVKRATLGHLRPPRDRR